MPAGERPEHGPSEGSGGGGGPRPTRSPVPNQWRRPAESGLVADRLNILVHELAGLVDGSMRHIGLALRSVDDGLAERRESEDLSQRLKTIQHALERMADALRTASGGPPMPWVQGAYGASLADAANYAVGIMEPIAAARAISITLSLDDRFAKLPPGHLYTVLVNGIRNGIEAIVFKRARPTTGTIRVEGRIETRQNAEFVVIHITDTGVGPPPLPAARRDIVFHPDFSTKPGGLGIGLAISRRILDEMGGTLELRKGPGGVGATLAIEYRLSHDQTEAA